MSRGLEALRRHLARGGMAWGRGCMMNVHVVDVVVAGDGGVCGECILV